MLQFVAKHFMYCCSIWFKLFKPLWFNLSFSRCHASALGRRDNYPYLPSRHSFPHVRISKCQTPKDSLKSNTHLSQVEVVERHLRLRVDVLQVPTEGLALEAVPQSAALRKVPYFHTAGSFKIVHENN